MAEVGTTEKAETTQEAVSGRSAGQRPDPEKGRGGALLLLCEEAERVLAENVVVLVSKLLANFKEDKGNSLASFKMLLDLAEQYRKFGFVSLEVAISVSQVMLRSAVVEGLVDRPTLEAAGLAELYDEVLA